MPQNKESSEPKANHNISSRLASDSLGLAKLRPSAHVLGQTQQGCHQDPPPAHLFLPMVAYPDNFAGRQRKLTTKCWVGCGVWPADPLLIVSQTPPKEACILKEAFPLPRRSALQLVLVPVVEPSSESAVASTDARRCACARPIFAPTVRRGISGQA